MGSRVVGSADVIHRCAGRSWYSSEVPVAAYAVTMIVIWYVSFLREGIFFFVAAHTEYETRKCASSWKLCYLTVALMECRASKIDGTWNGFPRMSPTFTALLTLVSSVLTLVWQFTPPLFGTWAQKSSIVNISPQRITFRPQTKKENVQRHTHTHTCAHRKSSLGFGWQEMEMRQEAATNQTKKKLMSIWEG